MYLSSPLRFSSIRLDARAKLYLYQAYCVFRFYSLMFAQNFTTVFYKYIPLITLKLSVATLFERGDTFF